MKTAASSRRFTFACLTALAIAGFYFRAIAADPATQPVITDASAPSEESLTIEFRKQFGYLQDAMGSPAALVDPAKRAEGAPKSVEILHKLVDLCDQMAKIDPDNAAEVKQRRADFMWHLALFGDSDATRTLATEAGSADPATALEGKRSMIMVSWLSSADDVDHQTALVDRIEKLAQDNAADTALTMQLCQMEKMGCSSPDLANRLTAMITDVMKNDVAAQIKQQMEADQKLATIENQPLTITGKTPEDKNFTTADWKGKVILVDFWATWCGPCREELPRVKKMYQDYHAKGLEILGVSNDQSADDLAKFLKEDGAMPWQQLLDLKAAGEGQWNPVTTGFGIKGIPTMFLIDRKGVCRSVTARENMETLIPQLLDEK